MEKIYYDVGHPAAFGGVEPLQRAVKTTRSKTLDFLQRSDAYTQFVPVRHRFTRRKTIAYSKFELIQADLCDLQKLSRFNSGYRYILVAIDVLSKYVFYIPLKNKKPDEIKRAFKKIFKTAVPKLIQTDEGTEFKNKIVQNYFKQKNIKWYYTYSGSKSVLAERQIRTLRERLGRIFQHTGSYKYYHILDDLAKAYNARTHSRTGFAPNDVNKSNEHIVFEKLFGGIRRTGIKPRFKIGDQVRLAKTKGIFAKSHQRNFTEELFKIKRITMSDPIQYYLEDGDGNEILGGAYSFELNKVIKGPTDLWDVEKIIKKRRDKNGNIQYLVKWRGYGKEHNSWVSDIQRKK